VYHADQLFRNAHAEEPPAAIHYAGKGSPRDEIIKEKHREESVEMRQLGRY
jgi:hypothetical protein